ncbi:hypothetical protein SIN8267_00077 [Sinobacterium norvegicum]|uniref:DUF2062 domain-containing protein n=1 Tax=Sinobacterium norvegicum TaxID=1641715 RepID=A0ABN8EEQ3_9GAMM|nr:DUF2062 domain-containing protein [Sinobacterium norvegicum]CAH0990000.1 hypothetical protein SIN8267_00077 [Sinobacterium norvegicum]
MARKFFKRYMPDPEKIKSNKSLRFMGTWLHDPNLFHLNRRSASLAFFIGLFVAFLPIPSQMIVAAALAILVRCNLPISVLLVWITNPVTMPAIFYGAYKVGAIILQVPTQDFAFELSLEWLIEEIAKVWQPLLLGSVICGVISGTIGYVVVRATWRFHVITRWKNRKHR